MNYLLKFKKEGFIDIFVYGTLKKGRYNHYILEESELIGEYVTPPIYTLYDGVFPVVERGGEGKIKGELYRITNNKVLEALFRLEGFTGDTTIPSWYTVDELPNRALIFVQQKGQSERTKICNESW